MLFIITTPLEKLSPKPTLNESKLTDIASRHNAKILLLILCVSLFFIVNSIWTPNIIKMTPNIKLPFNVITDDVLEPNNPPKIGKIRCITPTMDINLTEFNLVKLGAIIIESENASIARVIPSISALKNIFIIKYIN